MTDLLYLDIETVGTVTAEEVAETITPPKSIKKDDTLADWHANTKPELVKEAVNKAALRGETGRVVCIGWAWDDAPAQSVCLPDETEATLLRVALDGIAVGRPVKSPRPTIVGHNVADFDIRFLWQRAFVHGVRMPHWLPRDVKPWSNELFDTMRAWSSRDYISLDALCKVLGLPGKGNLTGADVQGMWERGDIEALGAYCRSDIELVRNIHRKMQAAFGAAA